MYMVYWTATEKAVTTPKSREFNSDEMLDALRFAEEMRKIQRSTGEVKFITFVSENPNCVGHAGVAEVGPDYDWKKRRI